MYKFVSSSPHHSVKNVLTSLEEKVISYEQQGYIALGPAQIIKCSDGCLYAYITLVKRTTEY